MRKSKILKEICDKIQGAEIGEIISTQGSNGKIYCYKVREYLESLGYTYGKDFENQDHHHFFIKKFTP